MSLEERWGPAILNLGFHDTKSLMIKRVIQFLITGVIAETAQNRSNFFFAGLLFFSEVIFGRSRFVCKWLGDRVLVGGWAIAF